MQNKAHKSGMISDPRCLHCDEVETMEHLLYGCEHFSAKIWALLEWSMTLAISQHIGEYVLNLVLTPLEIVLNKPHPSILLHIKDASTRKVLIILLQETKCDIIFRHAQLQTPRRREELHPILQAHLVSGFNKIIALLEYFKVNYSILTRYPSCHKLYKLLFIPIHNSYFFTPSSNIHATHVPFHFLHLFCAVIFAKIQKKTISIEQTR
jgi:hypothetical protein